MTISKGGDAVEYIIVEYKISSVDACHGFCTLS